MREALSRSLASKAVRVFRLRRLFPWPNKFSDSLFDINWDTIYSSNELLQLPDPFAGNQKEIGEINETLAFTDLLKRARETSSEGR